MTRVGPICHKSRSLLLNLIFLIETPFGLLSSLHTFAPEADIHIKGCKSICPSPDLELGQHPNAQSSPQIAFIAFMVFMAFMAFIPVVAFRVHVIQEIARSSQNLSDATKGKHGYSLSSNEMVDTAFPKDDLSSPSFSRRLCLSSCGLLLPSCLSIDALGEFQGFVRILLFPQAKLRANNRQFSACPANL